MTRRTIRTALLGGFLLVATAAAAQDEDASWPRILEGGGYTVTMYEPQIDSWADDRFEARAAVSVPGASTTSRW